MVYSRINQRTLLIHPTNNHLLSAQKPKTKQLFLCNTLCRHGCPSRRAERESGGMPCTCNICSQLFICTCIYFLHLQLFFCTFNYFFHLELFICTCIYVFAPATICLHLQLYICTCNYLFAPVTINLHLQLLICTCNYLFASSTSALNSYFVFGKCAFKLSAPNEETFMYRVLAWSESMMNAKQF